MIKRLLPVALAALPLLACHDDDTVAGPDVVYPGIGFSTAEWSLCGRHSTAPNPDYSNPELRVAVEQRGSHFSVRVADVGTIAGELAPFEPGVLRYSWTLRLDAPCAGVVQGADTSTDNEMRFTIPPSDDWQCTPCTDTSSGMVRLYIPVQPI